MEEELKKQLIDFEKRIAELESAVFSKKMVVTSLKKAYKGLAGGIQLIIDNKFLDHPKSANEIKDELAREGYHHSISSLSKMLSVNFTKNKKVLNRIREDDIWKYVLRK